MLRAFFKFHWGFWARPHIFTARQPTMTVPPPSMFVGALARGLAEVERARGRWVPEYAREGGRYYVPLAYELARCVERVYFRIWRGGVSAAVDKTRMFQGPYIRRENLGDPRQWFGVRDVGKAYAPGAEAEFALLADLKCLEESLGEALRRIDEAGLAAAAYAVTRLGPAEGLVAVTRAEVLRWGECREASRGVYGQPCPYFPWGGGELPDPWRVAEFIDWRREEAWDSRRVQLGEGAGGGEGLVAYAVPESAWSTLRVEFPSCSTLRSNVKIIECGGVAYVDSGF